VLLLWSQCADLIRLTRLGLGLNNRSSPLISLGQTEFVGRVAGRIPIGRAGMVPETQGNVEEGRA
jgi:hypothetical protein